MKRSPIKKQAHARTCQLRLAREGAAAIECQHGYDTCPICDRCTCYRGRKRAKPKAKRPGPPRRGRVVDTAYLAWVASQPCIVTGLYHVTVHHVRRFGEPKNDHRTVPLVARLHMLTHEEPDRPCVERGKAIFERHWGVNLEGEITRLRTLYREFKECH